MVATHAHIYVRIANLRITLKSQFDERLSEMIQAEYRLPVGYDKSRPPDRPTIVELLFDIDQVINVDDDKNVRIGLLLVRNQKSCHLHRS